jgi:hypothetical protein
MPASGITSEPENCYIKKPHWFFLVETKKPAGFFIHFSNLESICIHSAHEMSAKPGFQRDEIPLAGPGGTVPLTIPPYDPREQYSVNSRLRVCLGTSAAAIW